MRLARSAIVAVLVALACVPAAQSAVSAPVGSTATTLYLHLLGPQDFPVNTQRPEPSFVVGVGSGLAAHTLTCLPDPPAGGSPFMDWHTWYGFSTPTYVDYEFVENGKPRYNNQRGLSWDLPFDPALPAVLHWYLEVGGPASAVPLPLANVVVEATMRAPDSVSADDSAYGTGQVLAKGRSAPALLAGDATQGAEHSMAGGGHVYGFEIPLEYEAATIPGATGYTLTVQASIDNPACGTGSGNLMASQVAPFADPEHQPRIELAVSDVLRIDALEVHFVNDEVVVQSRFNSAWGSYDLDEANFTLTIEGPDGPVEPSVVHVIQRTREWSHFTEPAQVTWAWDSTGPGAVPGLYWVNLTIANDQHTAGTVAHAAFRLGPDRTYPAPQDGGLPDVAEPEQAMPGLGAALLAVALAAAAAVVARRR